jgi:ketosteroid isomerase-like protein
MSDLDDFLTTTLARQVKAEEALHSGDLAYTAGYEHTSASWDGVPMEPYVLRVTHAYRREDGEWKIVHRHADPLSAGQGPPVGPAQAGGMAG